MILKYWPIIVVALAAALATGAQQAEIQSIKEVQIRQQINMDSFDELGAQQARIDERTQSIKENQQRQERMLETIIRKLQ